MATTIKVIKVVGKGAGYTALGLVILAILGFYAFIGWGFTTMAYEDYGLSWPTIVMGTLWVVLLVSIIAYLWASWHYA